MGKVQDLIHGGALTDDHGDAATSAPETREDERAAVALDYFGRPITWHEIRNLLSSGFGSGSVYWYVFKEFNAPAVGKVLWPGESKCYAFLDYPVREGGSVVVSDNGESGRELKPVNRETLVEGLKIMAAKYPRQFADFLLGNGDGSTGDVFLQCVVFGDVVFG